MRTRLKNENAELRTRIEQLEAKANDHLKDAPAKRISTTASSAPYNLDILDNKDVKQQQRHYNKRSYNVREYKGYPKPKTNTKNNVSSIASKCKQTTIKRTVDEHIVPIISNRNIIRGSDIPRI